MSSNIAVRAGRTAAGLAIMAILGLGSLIGAQNIIENPAKPLAKDGGRVLKLTEVWRITDDAGEFFFKYPQDLRIADDGSIFLREVGQFLRFSADGKFLKDIFRKGQGPGEMSDSAFQYYLHGQDLFILHRNSSRFWRADLEGRFQEQYDITSLLDPDFIGVVPEGFLFLTFVWPPRNEFTGKSVDIPYTLAEVGGAGRKARDITTLKSRAFLAAHRVSFDILVIKPGSDGEALYVFNGWDYRIEVLDPASGATLKRFSRLYPKVRMVMTDAQEDERRKNNLPKYEYMPDINNLYPTTAHLWVETSTVDMAKGRLIDIFDKDGRFLDSFYLGAGRTLMAVQEGFIFCQEKNEDDKIVIVKYRIRK